MRTSAIKPGDIVLVDDGLPYYALVSSPAAARRMVVTPLGRPAPRTVKTRDVVGHWRRAGGARGGAS